MSIIFSVQNLIARPDGRTAKGEHGQVLVETMVALSMTVIGLVGILTVLNASIGLNRVITSQYISSYLAGEGVELAGYRLDNNVFASSGYQANLSAGAYVSTMSANGLALSRLSQGVAQTPAAVFALPDSLVYMGSDSFGNITYLSSIGGAPVGASSTPFHRVVFVSWPSSDEAVVNSIVAWQTKGGVIMSVNAEDHFFNWRKP